MYYRKKIKGQLGVIFFISFIALFAFMLINKSYAVSYNKFNGKSGITMDSVFLSKSWGPGGSPLESVNLSLDKSVILYANAKYSDGNIYALHPSILSACHFIEAGVESGLDGSFGSGAIKIIGKKQGTYMVTFMCDNVLQYTTKIYVK